MRRSIRAAALTAVAFGAIAAPAAADEVLYGLTSGNGLVSFGSASPGAVSPLVQITGPAAGEDVVGIDVRPRTGELYAVTSASRLLKVNPTTGSSTFVANLSGATLSGSEFGVDFNPQVDRLRIVSNTMQNLRVNPDTGAATVDTTLGSNDISASAYTKNFNGTSSTTLYDINTQTDRLVTQAPPNDGTLNDVGALGVDAATVAGFDIGGAEGVAYASLTAGAATSLYTINLASGAATSVGALGASVRDIAVARQEPTGYVVSAGGTTLSSFLPSSGTPGVAAPPTAPGPQVVTPVGLFSGFAGTGETIVGIDFRPATDELYAVARGSDSKGRLYKVNRSTAALTQVGSAPFAIDLQAAEYGMDFNPTVDRIRLVNDADQSLRINPNDGAVVDFDPMTAGVQPDGNLAFAAGDVNLGDNPNVVAAAYSNNFAGATSTTLYDIDTFNQIIAIQNPPNNGALNTQTPPAGSLVTSTGADAGYDITSQDNAAYGVLDQGNSVLYRLQSGVSAIAAQGQQGSTLGSLTDADSLSFATSGAIALSGPAQSVDETAGSATVTITRSGGEGTVNVRYATADGSATAGSDYTSRAGSVTFQPGETSKTIAIAIADDAANEGPETLTVTLTRSAGGYRFGTTVQTITINASDPAAVVTPPVIRPGPGVVPKIVRVRVSAITAKVTPKRDRRAPYRFTTTGKITPASPFATVCTGKVRVQVKRGLTSISTRSVSLRKDCTYRSTVSFANRARLGRAGRLRFIVRFLGNPLVLPKSAKSVTVTARR